MGCLCSKGTSSSSNRNTRGNSKRKNSNKSSVQLSPSEKIQELSFRVNGIDDDSTKDIPLLGGPSTSYSNFRADGSIEQVDGHQGEKTKTVIVERPSSKTIEDSRVNGSQKVTNKIISMPGGSQAELVVAGWPSWLSSVAAEAIQGWVPRRPDSFEKLDKIGQGTYSSVYKANDLETGKVVAMKKVRFFNMDPESVRFMAREILILRKLDHPNIMKLEGLVTSRMSGSLYLVFEYMEHDLAGLLATPGINFTEPQIKCYMQQLLYGLEHCHSRGVLHRDIKGSNLLVNNDGVLKVGDFGLATFFKSDKKQQLTSRVVTLWYRAPELLLGSTDYGVAVDMWSAGCIVAELFVGKPIMPGRTEVEQMHKIFKLCGSPSESYWKKTKFPHATSFKPQQPYKRRLTETFKEFPSSALALVNSLLSIEPEKRGNASTALNSEFFTTSPLPCDPSSLPKYSPSKEIDIKIRDEEAKRKKADNAKGRGHESVRRGPRKPKQTLELDANGDTTSQRQKGGRTQRNVTSAMTDESHRQNKGNGFSQCNSMVHPSSWGTKEDDGHRSTERTYKSSRVGSNSRSQRSVMVQGARDSSNSSYKKDDWSSRQDNGQLAKKNKMHYSGPLVPLGGNLEDMLKEHERQIQQAVRKSRIEKGQQQQQ